MAITEGTKDVSQAQERTDPIPSDTVVIINSVTKEAQQLPLDKLGQAVAEQTKIAPADFDDFFGI